MTRWHFNGPVLHTSLTPQPAGQQDKQQQQVEQ